MFPLFADGIVEYLSFEVTDNLFLALAGGLCQVIHIDPAVEIQAACQRLCRCQLYGGVYLLERYGFAHNV